MFYRDKISNTHDYFAERLEVLPQLRCGNVLLEVADEQRSRRFRMILVELRLVRPELVVLDVVALVRGHLDLAAEEELVVRHLERLLDVLRFLEAHESVPVARSADNFDPRHFPVFLVLVKETVLERRVAATGRQVPDAYREGSPILGDRCVSGTMRRTAR